MGACWLMVVVMLAHRFAAVDSETKVEIAIKKIGNALDNRIDAKRTLREIKLLRHMDHENVIAIKGIIRPPEKDAFNDVYIVYELMITDLHQIIRSEQPLTDAQFQNLHSPPSVGRPYQSVVGFEGQQHSTQDRQRGRARRLKKKTRMYYELKPLLMILNAGSTSRMQIKEAHLKGLLRYL